MIRPEDNPNSAPNASIPFLERLTRTACCARWLKRELPAPPFLRAPSRKADSARWSFLAVDPFATFLARGSRILETRGPKRRVYRRHPLRAFKKC